jgi:protein-tyrosine kinase
VEDALSGRNGHAFTPALATLAEDGERLAGIGDASDAGRGDPQSRVNIDFAALQQLGFLNPATPRSRLADEFRAIKRPLLRNIDERSAAARGLRPNLIMVTSALQGDGKTFNSINLAVSIAMEQDRTVLFVDADVVRATAGRTLGVDGKAPGLIDLLKEGSEIEPADVILRTNMNKLSILPAGNASDKSTELLASDTMHAFMIELADRYPDRVVVFDSPPLLMTTEASVLASFMGQIVFVASADLTPQTAVQEALEQIGEDKLVGMVLNRASQRRSKLLGIGSYGYGYGYGYGSVAGRTTEESGTVSP